MAGHKVGTEQPMG